VVRILSDEEGAVRRAVLYTVLGLATLLIVVVALGVWAVFVRPASASRSSGPVRVTVERGASTRAIADSLAEAGIIANPNMFRLAARVSGADGKLKPGTYRLDPGSSYGSVIGQLRAGPPISTVSVTIPEGLELKEIAQRLEDRAGISADEFMSLADGGAARFADAHPYLENAYRGSLEGYLFPKTYQFVEGTTAEKAIETMLTQFDKEIADIDLADAERRGLSLEDVVTVASIIEKEARLDKERALVSSVIRNRMDRGVPLEICATIEYVLPRKKFRLTYRDLRIDTPYNSYLHRGLPPGPISNPGLESLKAAAAPADTGYFYYVLTGKDGSHTFTETRAEFLKAKQKSKEVFGR
jgi:UPF0755 protein